MSVILFNISKVHCDSSLLSIRQISSAIELGANRINIALCYVNMIVGPF